MSIAFEFLDSRLKLTCFRTGSCPLEGRNDDEVVREPHVLDTRVSDLRIPWGGDD